MTNALQIIVVNRIDLIDFLHTLSSLNLYIKEIPHTYTAEVSNYHKQQEYSSSTTTLCMWKYIMSVESQHKIKWQTIICFL